MSEAKLQQQCFMWHWNTYPSERGRLWMQYNNPKNAAHGAVLKGMGLVNGVADMAYLAKDGKPVFIEFKIDKGRQSDAQKWWQGVVESVGAKYFIVRTFEDFKDIINLVR